MHVEPRSAVATAPPVTRARILLVDDDESARGALAKLLSSDGYAVTAVSNGEAALASARRSLPDVVLTDLEMPKMDGVSLCEHLHELDGVLPVIVMTAHSDIQSAIASLRAGAEDYLIKPLQYEAVFWHVERTLARRAATLELERASTRHEELREEYLALISHDLRTPLSNIMMCAAMLKESLESKGMVADVKLAERAEHNVRRMSAMLEELTEATSLESGGASLDLVPCDMLALVKSVVDGMTSDQAGRITVIADDTVPHVVLADSSRLERVLTNLLTNALKYSAADAPVVARIMRSANTVQVAVVDRGIGIAAESIGMLFERYYRTKAGRARAGGLGLGLYIARMIVEMHGGAVRVVSELGRGSTFTVLFPSYIVAP